MICMALDNLRSGSHVLLFPEGTRTVTPPVGRITGAVGADRLPRPRAGADRGDRDRQPLPGQGLAAVAQARLPLTYQVRLGRRFDAPANSAPS